MYQPLQHLKYNLKYFALCFIPDNQKASLCEPSFGATSIKPKLNGSLPPPPTSTRTSIMGLPHTPTYRRKTLQYPKLSEGIYSVHVDKS